MAYRKAGAWTTGIARRTLVTFLALPTTLTGVPKEIYQLWYKHFRPRGYRLRVQIIDFPGGMPGDIAMTLCWE